MTESGHCFLCLERDELSVCPTCRLVMTCSLHHHLHHNPAGGCYSFRMEHEEEVGRYLVATRRIKPGEIIYRDRPAVIGPNMRNTEAHCITCLRLGCEEECQACGFPVCDESCAGEDLHQEECQIFQEAGYRYEGTTALSAVTVLRLLLAMESRDQSLLETMMDHNQERRLEHPEVWSFEKEFVVSHLQDRLGLRFSEEQIRRAAGILATNSTTLQFPSEDHVKGNGLYPVYSMMNHSCSCNTKTIIDSAKQFEMTIMANVELSAGDEITNQYMKPDKPSLYRRPLLRQKWHFDCSCVRCLDPTELGSHLSSLRCPGRVSRISRRQCEGTLLLTSPTNTTSDWACQSCGLVINHQQAFTILDRANSIQEEAINCLHTDTDHNGNVVIQRTGGKNDPDGMSDGGNQTRGGLSVLEEAIFRLSSLLHHSNYFTIQVKLKLISLYEIEGPRLSRTQLQRQVQLCSEVMECLARVDSGYSEWRTKIIPALSRAKMTAANRDLQRGLIPKSRFDKLVMENRFMILYLAYQHAKVRI